MFLSRDSLQNFIGFTDENLKSLKIAEEPAFLEFLNFDSRAVRLKVRVGDMKQETVLLLFDERYGEATSECDAAPWP